MAEGTKTYTLAEVAQHKVTKGADKSVWVVIHDKVYDVTPFLDEVNKGIAKEDLIAHFIVAFVTAVHKHWLAAAQLAASLSALSP